MTSFDDIVADFAFLEDWDERYKYLIDLGRGLPEFPEAQRNDATKVRGCASQVWLHHETGPSETDPSVNVITFIGDSDAHIVKGLVAVVLALYNGKTASEIRALNAGDAMAPLALEGHLTPQRTNGLAAMTKRIQAIAETEAV
ncbi:MAG: SufE family protein [Pseudomonadota bacterium]